MLESIDPHTRQILHPLLQAFAQAIVISLKNCEDQQALLDKLDSTLHYHFGDYASPDLVSHADDIYSSLETLVEQYRRPVE